MNEEHLHQSGYGFPADFAETPEDRESALQRVLANLPTKGPDCPLEADLIDFVHDQVPAKMVQIIRDHLPGCAYCQHSVRAYHRRTGLSGMLAQSSSASVLNEQSTGQPQQIPALRPGTPTMGNHPSGAPCSVLPPFASRSAPSHNPGRPSGSTSRSGARVRGGLPVSTFAEHPSHLPVQHLSCTDPRMIAILEMRTDEHHWLHLAHPDLAEGTLLLVHLSSPQNPGTEWKRFLILRKGHDHAVAQFRVNNEDSIPVALQLDVTLIPSLAQRPLSEVDLLQHSFHALQGEDPMAIATWKTWASEHIEEANLPAEWKPILQGILA